ncbi:unnamed protein product [Amoebophrya sp. A120]|nr:unnamed protein product [Amoebophrya sp. A120]|eukprot:GSA120T00008725001.1
MFLCCCHLYNFYRQTVCAQSCSDAMASQPSRARSIFPMYTLPSSNSSKTTTTTTTTTTTSSALLLEEYPAPALEGGDGQNNKTNSTPGEQEDGGILDQCGTLPIPGYGETRLFPFLLICVGAVLVLAGLGVAVCINFVCAAEVEEEVDQVWHLPPEGHGSSISKNASYNPYGSKTGAGATNFNNRSQNNYALQSDQVMGGHAAPAHGGPQRHHPPGHPETAHKLSPSHAHPHAKRATAHHGRSTSARATGATRQDTANTFATLSWKATPGGASTGKEGSAPEGKGTGKHGKRKHKGGAAAAGTHHHHHRAGGGSKKASTVSQ